MIIDIDTKEIENLSGPLTLILEECQAFKIENNEDYVAVVERSKATRARIKSLEAERVKITKPILEGKKRIDDLFKKPMSILQQADEIDTRAILNYDAEQQKIRALKQLELEQQAEAEKQALLLEQQEKLEAAEALLEDEAFMLPEEIEAAKQQIKELRNGAEECALQFELIEVADVKIDTPKVSGVSTRTMWKAECTDLMAVVKHIFGHPEFLEVVEINQPALNALARSLKNHLKIPGIRVYEEKSLALSSR